LSTIDGIARSTFSVAFEGLDGAGKSTRLRLLAAALQARGAQVHAFRLNDNPLFKQQCRILNQHDLIDPVQAALMKASELCGRIEYHVGKLAEGNAAVLWDKYAAGSLAADAARGVPDTYLQAINRALPQPTFTIYLQIAPEDALRRKILLGGPRMMESGLDHELGISVREAHSRWKSGAIPPEVMNRAFTAFQTRIGAAYERFLPSTTIRLDAMAPPDVLDAQIIEAITRENAT
jgi:thymidylate kinase